MWRSVVFIRCFLYFVLLQAAAFRQESIRILVTLVNVAFELVAVAAIVILIEQRTRKNRKQPIVAVPDCTKWPLECMKFQGLPDIFLQRR